MTEVSGGRSGSAETVLRLALDGQPELRAALVAVHEQARSSVDPRLLDLCEARIARLLGAGEPVPTPSGHLDQACVAFTDQFVIDVAGIDDALVAPIRTALGPEGLVAFVNALLVVEQRLRLELTLRRVIPEVVS